MVHVIAFYFGIGQFHCGTRDRQWDISHIIARRRRRRSWSIINSLHSGMLDLQSLSLWKQQTMMMKKKRKHRNVNGMILSSACYCLTTVNHTRPVCYMELESQRTQPRTYSNIIISFSWLNRYILHLACSFWHLCRSFGHKSSANDCRLDFVHSNWDLIYRSNVMWFYRATIPWKPWQSGGELIFM